MIIPERSVEEVEKYLGFLSGRCLFKLKNHKHDIMTKKILHVDVISQTLLTSETLYVCNGKLTMDELINIYDDVQDGKNTLRFIKKNSLEKPNESMKERYK